MSLMREPLLRVTYDMRCTLWKALLVPHQCLDCSVAALAIDFPSSRGWESAFICNMRYLPTAQSSTKRDLINVVIYTYY